MPRVAPSTPNAPDLPPDAAEGADHRWRRRVHLAPAAAIARKYDVVISYSAWGRVLDRP